MIVLADVLEHLDDPVEAIDRCQRLLAPGGVLCVVTPDPSSPHRAAGGLALVGLPARAHLPAARAPRCASCSSARGLSSRRTCRWCARSRSATGLDGLAERSGPRGAAAGWLRRSRPGPGARVAVARRRARGAGPQRRADRAARAARVATAAATRRCTSCCRPTTPRRRSRSWPPRCRCTPPTARCSWTTPARTRPSAVALREGFDVLRHPGQPRLRREPEDLLHARRPRRRRHRGDGPRRQPVRPRARRRDGAADRGGLRRRGDRLAPARGRDDRGRHAALEVDRQPLPHLGREPRLPAALLGVPHRATAPSPSTSCARSRSTATATASSSTRRSSPRSWPATPAWSSWRSPRATSSRPRASPSGPA